MASIALRVPCHIGSSIPEARPQTGIESADLVYEEVVDGGITAAYVTPE